MGDFKAIETSYRGHRFRSRLEARWAVVFDALGIAWEYEPQGFETSKGPYLPDFRISPDSIIREAGHDFDPTGELYVEVKGMVHPPRDESVRVGAFVFDAYKGGIDRAIMLLGPVPDAGQDFLVWHSTLSTWRTTGKCFCSWGSPTDIAVSRAYPEGEHPDNCPARKPVGSLAFGNGSAHLRSGGVIVNQDKHLDPLAWNSWVSDFSLNPQSAYAAGAYAAGRRARFEHGETPR